MSLVCIKKLSSRFSIILVLLLLAIGSIYFIQPRNISYQQRVFPFTKTLLTETTSEAPFNKEVFLQEKRNVEENLNVCQNDKKKLEIVLEIERKTQQTYNATLINEQMKLCEQKWKRILEPNATAFDRKLFKYMATFLRDTPYPGVENYTRYTVARLGMSPLPGIEPLKPEYGPVINDVTSFRYPMTIPACQTNVSFNQSVFIAVISAPGNFDKRNTIRQTWRKHLKSDYHKGLMSIAGFAFILGLTDNNETQIKTKEESKTHGDIIQIDMADFYRNLSLKVAGLFNWLYRNCLKIDFLFKVDDDVYVNVRNLAHFVTSHNRSDQSIYGNSAGNLFPARGGQWVMTVEEWPWKDYPRYFFGPGVIFPGSTILPLLAAFQTTPLMTIDDTYYSGICSEKAGLKVRWSTESTGVMVMGQPAVPFACDLRRFISWLTVSANHMNNSHVVTDNFYQNKSQCMVTASNGTNTTIDYTSPVQFEFN